MTNLKTTISDILVSNGFAYLISFSEQVARHRGLLVGIIACWVVLNLVGMYRPSLILIWLLSVGVAFLFEQLYQWFALLVKRFRGQSVLSFSILFRQSLSRRMSQRLNFWLVVAYLFFKYFFLSLHDLPTLLPLIHQVTYLLTFFCEIIVLSIYLTQFIIIIRSPVMLLVNILIQTYVEINRSRDQIMKVINTGFRMSIPGIALAFMIGFISQELWQLISGLSWLRIGLVALLIFLVIIIPSIGMLKQGVTKRLSQIGFEAEAFQGKSIRQAILRLSPKAIENQSLDNVALQAYEEQISWKWKYDLFVRSKEVVIEEKLKRAVIQLWSSIVIFFPLVLMLILAMSIVVFPRSILQKWIDNTPAASTSILAVDEDLRGWWTEISKDPLAIFDDPLLKYSLICALILVGQFAVSNSVDANRVLSSFEKEIIEIQDLILLIGAYYALDEEDFQFITCTIEFGQKENTTSLTPIPIAIVPEKANRAWVRRVITKIPDKMIPLLKKNYLSIMLVRRDAFCESAFMELLCANHPNADTLYSVSDIDLPESNTWVWISPILGGMVLKEFTSFEAGQEYVKKTLFDYTAGRQKKTVSS